MEVKGKSIEVLESQVHGNSRVLVRAQQFKMIKGIKTLFGPALEVAVGHIK